jgi:hypothetical protein
MMFRCRAAGLAQSKAIERAVSFALHQVVVEFPDLPAAVVYDKVSEARCVAAMQLPNCSAYACVLLDEVRARLRLEDLARALEGGTFCAPP